MPQTPCPACRAQISIDQPVMVGTRVICQRCGEEWVVSTVQSLRIDYELDDYIEDPDCSVRSRSRGPFRGEI
jgi:hypothetical protein